MDTLINALPLPLERVEEILSQAAVPGFWGSVSIGFYLVRLGPGAIYEVQLVVERRTTTMLDASKEHGLLIQADRVGEMRERFRHIADRLRVLLPIVEISANFRDGRILGPFQIAERIAEKLAQQTT